MLKNTSNRIMLSLLIFATLIAVVTTSIKAAEGSLTMTVEGLTASYEGNGTWTGGGASVSGTVAGTDANGSGCDKVDAAAKSETLTFTNSLSSGKAAYLTFDYNITVNHGSVKIGDDTLNGSGNYSVLVENNAAVSLVITSGAGSKLTTEIDLTNIALTEVSAVEVTFKAPENGSYKVNGTAVTKDAILEGDPPITYTVAATPGDGYKFFGWYSTATSSYLSFDASTTLTVTDADTIKAEFISSDTPVFKVGNSFYNDLDDANTAATNGSDKTIILVSSGTLPSDTYEISSGNKLLIPYDENCTANFDDEPTHEKTLTAPKEFRCLTLAEGVTINCYGEINVNAKMVATSAGTCCAVSGPYGAIKTASGSTINMESGSKLWAYGYIGGEGSVIGKSGSEIYQMLQVTDWRGGTDSLTLYSSLKGHSFLISQYYIQNIECMLTINHGSTLRAVIGVGVDVPFMGWQVTQSAATIVDDGSDRNGALFVTKAEGTYIEWQYDSITDRMNLDVYGDITTNYITISVTMGMNVTMKSSDYILPIPANYTMNVKDGSNIAISQKFKFLPGTVMTIENGANMTIDSGAAIYLYDHDDWNSGKFTYTSTIYQLPYVYAKNGKPVERKVSDDAVLEVNGTLIATGSIYTTNYSENGGDAAIIGTGKVVISQTGETKFDEVDNTSGDGTNTVEITCVPAVGKLAGYNELTSFGVGTYYGHEDNFWYQYTISLDDASMKYAPYFNVSDDYIGKATGDGNTIAYICAGGTMPFTSDLDVRSTFATVEDKVLTSTGTGNIVLTLTVPFKVQMVLGSSLDMRFAIPASLWSNRYTAKIIRNGASSTAVDWKDATIDGVAYKFFTFYGMTATEMTVILDIAVMDGDAEFAAYRESILSYAMRMLNDAKYANATEGTTEALARTMLVDMLNYGAAAQQYFDKETDVTKLANYGVTAQGTVANPLESFSGPDSGSTLASLAMNGTIDLRIQFQDLTDAAYARVEFDSHWDEVVHYLSGQIYSTEIENGVVTVDRLLMADARQSVTVKVYNSNGGLLAETSDSIAAYMKRMFDAPDTDEALKELFAMTLRFSDSAKAFLHARYDKPTTGTVTPYKPANS